CLAGLRDSSQLCVLALSEPFQVVVPAAPVVAAAGEDTVLPCSLSPGISAKDLEVRWFREDRKAMVCLYQYRRYNVNIQDPSYRGRAELFPEELGRGNVSLRLRDVRRSDHGHYKCMVLSPHYHTDADVQLAFTTLGSQPSVSLHSPGGGQTQLLCRAEGWFPAPAVIWTDRDGHDVTSLSSTTVEKDSQGLLSVSSFIPIQQESNIFSCLVKSALPEPDWESQIHIPRDFFSGPSGWMVALCVAAAVTVAASALLVIQWRRMDRVCISFADSFCFFTGQERQYGSSYSHCVSVTNSVCISVFQSVSVTNSVCISVFQCVSVINSVCISVFQCVSVINSVYISVFQCVSVINKSLRKRSLMCCLFYASYVKHPTVIQLFTEERVFCTLLAGVSLCPYLRIILYLLGVFNDLSSFRPAVNVTLDPDTAHPELTLSEDGKRVRLGEPRDVPDNRERFDCRLCVRGSEGFTSGRCYWEVEVNGDWRIGVTRESANVRSWVQFVPRDGYWCLESFSSQQSVRSKTVGVCVDIEEKKVSFYTVESRTHIFTFTDMEFGQGEKIYPVFGTWDRSKDLVLLPPVRCGNEGRH
ncbi:BT1A1 protein, partial [Atractosteus spatula]|nr:BT1A1 protein [Atractosteus spatula]